MIVIIVERVLRQWLRLHALSLRAELSRCYFIVQPEYR